MTSLGKTTGIPFLYLPYMTTSRIGGSGNPMKIKKLTIIIPVYNEAETVEQILIKVRSVKYSVPVETIIVNDGSTDATVKKLQAFVKRNHWLKYYQHEKNAGKGAALKTGISQ